MEEAYKPPEKFRALVEECLREALHLNTWQLFVPNADGCRR